jgi:toxin ParE1/3/4
LPLLLMSPACAQSGALMSKVRWTRTALSNLDEQAEFVVLDKPRAAAALVQRVFDAVEQLCSYPSMGRAGRIAGTRELVVAGTPLIVPYRVRDGYVEVLRVLHASRLPPEDM